jgi:hypothetical protein
MVGQKGRSLSGVFYLRGLIYFGSSRFVKGRRHEDEGIGARR